MVEEKEEDLLLVEYIARRIVSVCGSRARSSELIIYDMRIIQKRLLNVLEISIHRSITVINVIEAGERVAKETA